MKFAQFSIVAIIGSMIAVICTGCMTSEASTPAPVSTSAESTSQARVISSMQTIITSVPTTPGCANPPLNPWRGVPESYVSAGSGRSTTPPAPGTRVSEADLFGTPAHTWEEYVQTTHIQDIRSNGIIRYEISEEEYLGRPAVHKKIFSTLHLDGAPPEHDIETTTDQYFDEYHGILTQHSQERRNGETVSDETYPVDPANGSPDCTGDLFFPKYTYIGTETLTIPAGTFPDAREYTENITDDFLYGKSATSTHGFAPGVPAELKRGIESREKGVLITWELTGWG